MLVRKQCPLTISEGEVLELSISDCHFVFLRSFDDSFEMFAHDA